MRRTVVVRVPSSEARVILRGVSASSHASGDLANNKMGRQKSDTSCHKIWTSECKDNHSHPIGLAKVSTFYKP